MRNRPYPSATVDCAKIELYTVLMREVVNRSAYVEGVPVSDGHMLNASDFLVVVVTHHTLLGRIRAARCMVPQMSVP